MDYQKEVQTDSASAQAAAQPQVPPVQPHYTGETAYQPQGTYSDYDPSLEMFYEEQNASAKTFGAVGLGLGIGGFLTGWFGLGLILDLVAIALGVISINKNKFKKGLGIAAISVASLGFLLTMLVFGFSYSKWKDMGGLDVISDIIEDTDYDYDYTYDYDNDTVADTKTVTDTAKLKEKQHYSIGDTVTVQTDNGEYSFKINGVSETSDRNSYADTDPDRVILIDYEYENLSYAVEYDNYYNDKLYLSSGDFEFYDADGHSMDEYPISYEYPHSITPGHKTSGQMALGLDNDTNYIEMELDDYGYKGPGIVIDLDW